MPDHLVTADGVESLRHAAQARDWNACSAALDLALTRVALENQVALAEDFLRRRVSSFERAHPGDRWMRCILDGEGSEEDPEYDQPGGNTLATGLDYLVEARAFARTGAVERCTKAVREALSCAVMSELVALWGAMYPERWRAWYASPTVGPDDPRRGWFDHPDVRAADLARWNEIADRIEALIQRGS